MVSDYHQLFEPLSTCFTSQERLSHLTIPMYIVHVTSN